jgi:hypothetical protein
MKIYKFLLAIFFAAAISGCVSVIVDPKVGMNFDVNTWTSNGAYVYAGESSEGFIYRNNRNYSSFYNGGIVVYGGKVVKVVQPGDLSRYVSDQQRQKAQLQRDAQLKRQAQADSQRQQQTLVKSPPQTVPPQATPLTVMQPQNQSVEKKCARMGLSPGTDDFNLCVASQK